MSSRDLSSSAFNKSNVGFLHPHLILWVICSMGDYFWLHCRGAPFFRSRCPEDGTYLYKTELSPSSFRSLQFQGCSIATHSTWDCLLRQFCQESSKLQCEALCLLNKPDHLRTRHVGYAHAWLLIRSRVAFSMEVLSKKLKEIFESQLYHCSDAALCDGAKLCLGQILPLEFSRIGKNFSSPSWLSSE